MAKRSSFTKKQEEAIKAFFEFSSAAGYCEHLDDIFNWSLQVERQGTADEFTIIRQLKKLITVLDTRNA